MAALNGHVKIIKYLVQEHDPTSIDAVAQVGIVLCSYIPVYVHAYAIIMICRMVRNQFILPVIEGM